MRVLFLNFDFSLLIILHLLPITFSFDFAIVVYKGLSGGEEATLITSSFKDKSLSALLS